jgi:hypothetical protein
MDSVTYDWSFQMIGCVSKSGHYLYLNWGVYFMYEVSYKISKNISLLIYTFQSWS